ncbi:Gfo/Idh/MocA family oxidoreductase [Candidatus Woesearchaeota archaeon]|nr:Gfo/Idh/MocA family oxidoreductase [Candidatus Woesearchaeota archaeon]
MKLGIIGVGKWGQNFLKVFLELGAEVKWICSKTEATLEKAKQTGRAQATTDYKEILRDSEVNAVAISTPDPTHYQIVKDSLEAGKHVLVEKPFTLNSAEAEELIKIAEEKKLILMVGHIHRYNPGVQKLKEEIDSGAFGKVRHVQLIGTHTNSRDDTTVVWDFLPHDMTILSYLFGSYPKSISANGASFRGKGTDAVTADMRFGEVFAVSFASWVYPAKQRMVIVIGEKASAVFDDYARKLTYYGEGKSFEFDKMPLTEELKHFIDCVENNKKPLTDGAEGLKVVKVLEACDESIKKGGQPVSVTSTKT